MLTCITHTHTHKMCSVCAYIHMACCHIYNYFIYILYSLLTFESNSYIQYILLVNKNSVCNQEYERRKHARNEGRRYCDSAVLTYQAERMPEQIRLKVGGVTMQQTAVYEEFARNIPGFQTLSERDAALFVPKPVTVSVVLNSNF